MSIYFLIKNNSVLYVGELPRDYANISNLHGCSEEELADLTWANQPGLSFIKARTTNVPSNAFDMTKSYYSGLAAVPLEQLSQLQFEEVISKIKAIIAKNNKITEVNTIVSTLISNLKQTYAEEEVDSWTQQAIEAKNYTNNPTDTSGYQLLANIAQSRNVSLSLLVQKVIEKSNLYTSILGSILGNKQRLEDLLNSTTTEEEVNVINLNEGWPNL